ncbi:hypothetical protein K0M31_004086 [Melipona bicolor]|uniref:Uncharacterized protein n=1 Tax=Melipona bicolor TaxID=60889 RepID=A0AA40FY38_9HYME|nr:hypothetical protein K0M31_004086 [Melipona bicolor]
MEREDRADDGLEVIAGTTVRPGEAIGWFAQLVGKIGATVSKEQKERRVKFTRLKKEKTEKREKHVEGDGARPRGAAHKICLHSPEKKSRAKRSDEGGSRSAGSESESERVERNGEKQRWGRKRWYGSRIAEMERGSSLPKKKKKRRRRRRRRRRKSGRDRKEGTRPRERRGGLCVPLGKRRESRVGPRLANG